ncbi:ribosome hibernation-promoting factor, HPF/YfiA family [Maribacter sp. CXY002]|uniref:ribosome hibernation-promoting factor, HPF/YfiA family n=1 Tax=Maribacter luteocoastalis TaxID=3407671 RepID=UPI003B66B176
MTINIQYIHIPTSKSLNDFIDGDLTKLYNKFPFIIRADVTVKMENDQTGNGKVCEIELSVPGPRIFAKSSEENFEKAVVNTINDLDRQLRKRKEKFSKNKKAH